MKPNLPAAFGLGDVDARNSYPLPTGKDGASDRTVRACCQEHLGISSCYIHGCAGCVSPPSAADGDPAATSVTEIATNYGFWELGRFSVVAYRSM